MLKCALSLTDSMRFDSGEFFENRFFDRMRSSLNPEQK